MTKPALSEREPERSSSSHTTRLMPIDEAPSPAVKSRRAKKAQPASPAAPKTTALTRPRRESKRAAATASPTPQSKTQVGTLLIGAGIGAAITLSLLSFRAKSGKSSLLGTALVKGATYAIARTSAPGSLAFLVARAIGGSLP